MSSQPTIFLAQPILRNIHSIVYQSILKFAQPYVTHIHVEPGYAMTLDEKRNKCVRAFLDTDCTHLLFWDSDTVGAPGVIIELLKANKPVIAAVVYRKGGDHAPVFGYWQEDTRMYRVPVPFDYNKILEVDIVGTGFVLIKREVFEQLEEPWFQCYEKGNAWEDIYFCLKCKDAGIPIHVHTGLHLGHIATPYMVTNETYEMHTLWRTVKRARDLGRLDQLKESIYKILEEPVDILDIVDRARPRLQLSSSPSRLKNKIKLDVLIIGIDGLDGRAAETLNIPILDKMGLHGTMDSIPPYHTGPCWASMYTGLMPKDHGITIGGWEVGEPYTTMLKAPTIWEQLESVGILNMPITFPPIKVSGWMVSGYPCIENSKTHPIAFPLKVREYLPDDYVSDITSWGLLEHEMPENLKELGGAEAIRKLALSRVLQFKRIYDDYPVKVGAIGYTFPDRYGHMGEYDLTWTVLKEVLQSIFDNFEYKKLIIVSDHGFDGNVHSPNAFYLTNFGAQPKHLTDIYTLIRETVGVVKSPMRDVYNEYVSDVSNEVWAISWELSKYLIKLIKTLKPKRILDLGSGYSSYIFRKYSDAEVHSIDTEKVWLQKTKDFLEKNDVATDNVFHITEHKMEGEYDLILMDLGVAERDRAGLLSVLRNHCSGVIVLDDMHIANYRKQARKVYEKDIIIDLIDETKDKYGRYAWMVVPK